MARPKDPYAAPHAPREKSGPVVRFLIVAALLGAAAWGYTAFSGGPTLTERAEQTQAPSPG